MTPNEFLDLKDKVESIQRELDQALGAKAQTRKRLKLFNCKTIKGAKVLRKKWEIRLKKQEEQFNRELKEFEEQYEQQLLTQ